MLLMYNCVEHCDRVSMQQDTGEVCARAHACAGVSCQTLVNAQSLGAFAQAMLAQASHLAGLYRPGFDFVLQSPVSFPPELQLLHQRPKL